MGAPAPRPCSRGGAAVPMNRQLYPANWKTIAQEVKEQAGWACEWCGKPCRMPGEEWSETVDRILRTGNDQWYWETSDEVFSEEDGLSTLIERPQRFTLTVAHYPDHNPANCDRNNLVALCSTCHCQLDANPSSLAAKEHYKAENQGQGNLLSLMEWEPAIVKCDGPPLWHPARQQWEKAQPKRHDRPPDPPPADVLGDWDPVDDLELTLDQLRQEQQRLERSSLAPEGAWIEEGKCSKRHFRQAYWRAFKAIFIGTRSGAPTHRRYIGKVGSEKHKAAVASWQNRRKLEEVKGRIRLLEQIRN